MGDPCPEIRHSPISHVQNPFIRIPMTPDSVERTPDSGVGILLDTIV